VHFEGGSGHSCRKLFVTNHHGDLRMYRLFIIFVVIWAVMTEASASSLPKHYQMANLQSSLGLEASRKSRAQRQFAFTLTSTITVSTTFTPLHTYFLNVAGSCSDANSGISPSSPWCSPNHAVVCGDVIIAAAGSYGNGSTPNYKFGTVSNCPSTSGGIDGRGGIYFAVLLCGGSDLEACPVTSHASDTNAAFGVASSNWAVEGFKCTAPKSGCFVAEAIATGTTILHHIAFINDIAYNTDSGYSGNDQGRNTNVPGNGVDYLAVIGSIAQAANNSPVCLAAIDGVGITNFDNGAGTHIYFYGNFSYANLEVNRCVIDGEGFMFDTWDAHGFSSQGVMQNNMAWGNARFAFQDFGHNYNPTTSTHLIVNNTFYGNNKKSSGTSNVGDLQIYFTGYQPSSVIVQNNISQATDNSKYVFGYLIAGDYGSVLTTGGTGSENVFVGHSTVCSSGAAICDSSTPPFNAVANQGGTLGTNFYTSPGFTNTTDLTTNWVGTPICTGFENVTQCMGWNASTQTLTSLTPISDLTPTGTCGAVACSTKGYQLPSAECAPNSYFPAYLKGVIYLHWTGSIVQQRAGLVNVPCGM
jgi:hypothetical protein